MAATTSNFKSNSSSGLVDLSAPSDVFSNRRWPVSRNKEPLQPRRVAGRVADLSKPNTKKQDTPHDTCVHALRYLGIWASHSHARSYHDSPDVWVCDGLAGGTAAEAAGAAAVVIKRIVVGTLASCLAAVLLQGEYIGSHSLSCRALGFCKRKFY